MDVGLCVSLFRLGTLCMRLSLCLSMDPPSAILFPVFHFTPSLPHPHSPAHTWRCVSGSLLRRWLLLASSASAWPRVSASSAASVPRSTSRLFKHAGGIGLILTYAAVLPPCWLRTAEGGCRRAINGEMPLPKRGKTCPVGTQCSLSRGLEFCLFLCSQCSYARLWLCLAVW